MRSAVAERAGAGRSAGRHVQARRAPVPTIHTLTATSPPKPTNERDEALGHRAEATERQATPVVGVLEVLDVGGDVAGPPRR